MLKAYTGNYKASSRFSGRRRTPRSVLIILSLIIGAGSGFFVAKQFFPTIIEKEVLVQASDDNSQDTTIESEDTNTLVESNDEDVTTEETEIDQPVPVDTTLIYEADGTIPSYEQMMQIANILRVRLDNLGYTDAVIDFQNSNQLKIDGAFIESAADISSFLMANGYLEFTSANGEVVLTGADVETATAQCSQISENGEIENHVELKLNSEGTQKFSAATAAAASASDSQNYISISMDGQVLSTNMIQEKIVSETCNITGNFTPENARFLAAQINSGQLPFPLKAVELSALN